jgi:uncharacterized membrane protein YkgB
MTSLIKALAKSGLLRDGLDYHLVPTVTTIPFMPDGWEAAAGFPAMKGNVAFLMKDFVLLAVSIYLLKQDVARMVDLRNTGAGHAENRLVAEVGA